MEQLPVSFSRRPFGAGEVTIEGSPRTAGLSLWINVQHDPGNLPPVRILRVRIKHAHVRDSVLEVVGR
jgi:hypothetical protein